MQRGSIRNWAAEFPTGRQLNEWVDLPNPQDTISADPNFRMELPNFHYHIDSWTGKRVQARRRLQKEAAPCRKRNVAHELHPQGSKSPKIFSIVMSLMHRNYVKQTKPLVGGSKKC